MSSNNLLNNGVLIRLLRTFSFLGDLNTLKSVERDNSLVTRDSPIPLKSVPGA